MIQTPKLLHGAATSTYKIGGKHHGFTKCSHCGVAGYITEISIRKALKKGLTKQNLEIVSVAPPGHLEGTVHGMLLFLIKLFQDKGIRVR